MKSQVCPQCGKFNNRALTIDAIIIRDNKILLIKRGTEPFLGQWALPGGHVDWDEEITDTVIREVKEETALIVKSMKLFSINSKPSRDPQQKITLVYIVEADGEPKAATDALEFKWFGFKNLPETMAFDHKQIIGEYKKNYL